MALWPSDEPQTGLLQELFQRSHVHADGDEYVRVLEFVAGFPTASPYNAYLLSVQNPGVRYALSARQWGLRHGGRVRPDARPLVILMPFGPVEFVYDVADVDDARLPPDAHAPFRTTGRPPGRALEMLVENAKSELVQVRWTPRPTLAPSELRAVGPHVQLGEAAPVGLFADPLPTRRPRLAAYVISVHDGLDAGRRCTALVHELAHLLLGHVERPAHHPVPGSRVRARRDVGRALAELEAESVTYLVAHRLGLRERPAPYLAGFLRDARQETPGATLAFDAVLSVATTLLSWCERRARWGRGVGPADG
jgi:hypothetical protein